MLCVGRSTLPISHRFAKPYISNVGLISCNKSDVEIYTSFAHYGRYTCPSNTLVMTVCLSNMRLGPRKTKYHIVFLQSKSNFNDSLDRFSVGDLNALTTLPYGCFHFPLS